MWKCSLNIVNISSNIPLKIRLSSTSLEYKCCQNIKPLHEALWCQCIVFIYDVCQQSHLVKSFHLKKATECFKSLPA